MQAIKEPIKQAALTVLKAAFQEAVSAALAKIWAAFRAQTNIKKPKGNKNRLKTLI